MATGSPNYAITPNIGSGPVASVGDTSRTAPTSVATVLTAGANGSRIERLVLTALGSTVSSVLRLFLYDGTAYHEYLEQAVPAQTATAGVASWTTTLEAVSVPNLMPLLLKTGWSLRATINDTQLVQELNPQSIAQSQTTAAAAFLALNGTNVTAASSAAIAAAAAPTANTPMTLTATPVAMTAPAQITLTSSSGVSGVSFVLLGRDATGALVSETITGPGASATVYSVNIYKTIYAVTPTGTSANTVSVGSSAIAGSAILPLPSKIVLSSGANLSSITFTIKGTLSNGTVQSETLAGPNVGAVSSANTYASITSIYGSAAISSGVLVGNPAIIGGVSISAIGGDF